MCCRVHDDTKHNIYYSQMPQGSMKKEVIIAMLLLLPSALAVGISSSTEPLAAYTGEDIPITFTLINSKDENIVATITIDGDLKHYVTVPEREYKLKKEERIEITATARFPRGFQGSGKNNILLIASEETKDTEQITARTHSVIERTFFFDEEEYKTRVIPKQQPVYELPPKISPINPAIQIGDYFKTSVNAVKERPIISFLIAIVVLLALLNIQFRLQKRKVQKDVIEEILKGK